MKIVKTTEKGIDHLHSVLQLKPRTVTKVSFWGIPHRTQKEEICLKLARYKIDDFSLETLEGSSPKSELTLDNVEFENLLTFLSENYEPFKQGILNRKFLFSLGTERPASRLESTPPATQRA
jgi:hypothetical protein